jgi:RND superfamily putative drug exporter
MRRLLERLGRFAAESPWQMILRTLAGGLLVGAAAIAWHGELTDQLTVGGTDSAAATRFARDAFPERLAAVAEVVLVTDDGSTIDTPERRKAIDAARGRASHLRGAAFVEPAFGPGVTSTDGTTTVVTVLYDPSKLEERSVPDLRASFDGIPGVTAEVGGTMPEIAGEEDAGSEAFGLLAALVVLLIAFGSVVAAGLPIVVAVTSLAVGVGGVLLLARVLDVSSLAPQLAGIIGLGVGIDYALVVLTRFREELATGSTVDRAILATMASAGHAIVVAGLTVVISMVGLVATGVEALVAMGLATSICVLCTVIGSVTLLPALLRLLGHRVDALRLGRRSVTGRRSHLARWAVRHPAAAVVAGGGVVLLLVVPVAGIEVASHDASSQPEITTQRRAHNLLVDRFGPGRPTQLEVLVDLVPGQPGERSANAQRYADAVRDVPGVAEVAPPEFGRGGERVAVRFFPATGAQDDATRATLAAVRDAIVPIAQATGTTAWVGGETAVRIDFAERVSGRLPWMIGAVVAISLVALTVAFGSVVVAVKAAVLNLLTVGASYGAVVAVFVWGWGSSLFGLDGPIPLDPYVPVFLFAILFGLSMDYEVFIISRIRERYLAHRDNTASVIEGLDATARVVTSAAAVMAAVFASFLLGTGPITQMFGVGLATAVIVDATVVRLVVLPAVMVLLGRANWWAPRWVPVRSVHATG